MSTQNLIVLEGLDGAGKSTQINLIKKYFEEYNLKYEYIHFPKYEHNEYGKIISAFLRGEYGNIDEVDPIFVANIYAMDRYLYLPTLQKQLIENDVVLLDRYVFSNMAYQGAKYDNDTQSQIIRDWINEFEFGFLELPYPNLTIFFDVPIDAIEQRLNNKREGTDRKYLNGKTDIHEKDIQFQKKVRDNYLMLKNYTDYHIIDCTTEISKNFFRLDDPEELFNKYKNLLNNLFLF
jgi:dTMP kinase